VLDRRDLQDRGTPGLLALPIWPPTRLGRLEPTVQPSQLAARDISSFLLASLAFAAPSPACPALGRLHIAGPCHTSFPPSSIPRHIRPPHPTFRNPAWRTRMSSSQDRRRSPLVIPHHTRTRRRPCSPPTRIHRPKGSRAMSPTEGRRKAPTCRCRPSISLQFACKMDSNRRRLNLSQCSSPWALHSRRRLTACPSTMAIKRIRIHRPASR
jgi:hypothetical protein